MPIPTLAIKNPEQLVRLFASSGRLLGVRRQSAISTMVEAGRAKWVAGDRARLTPKGAPTNQWDGINWDDSMLPTDPYGAKAIAKGQAVRRQREADALGCHSHAEWEQVLAKHGNRCLRCEIRAEDTQYRRLTKDHIVPLASGGTDYASNLQPLCGRCNSWKGNREIDFRNKIA